MNKEGIDINMLIHHPQELEDRWDVFSKVL
jgi:hypothetical protein